ncbi:MAG: conjugal transfer protein TraG [Proteobacteria bacterium]|nr:conjugal transfer protein TraG [Pseudomonadota bacterium]
MYEVIVIGGGEFYRDVFNGLAMLLQSDDFLGVVAIGSSIAFAVAILNAALAGSLYDASKWFLTTFVITQVLLYPTATVQITDKTNPLLEGATIDNVPYVIAYTASTTSKIGYSLTTQFESVYSLPDNTQYSQNGMIFGVNMWNAMSQATITNSNLSSSVDSFIRECIFYDIEFNIYSLDDLKNSDDIWGFVTENQSENRFFTYTDSTGSSSTPSCKDGVTSLEKDWTTQYGSDDLISNLGRSASKPDLTKTFLSTFTPSLTEYFFEVSKSSEEMLRQAMMINAINSAAENYEAENMVDSYQNTRAMLQTKSTYKTMGVQAGIWIPMLKIVIESVFYAAFPLVIIVSLIPNMTGSVLRGYFTTFFWLASWGPIYAILHRISMGHGKTYAASGLTLYNQAGLEQVMGDIAAMAGYMSMFVPMLAFGIARGGAAAMSSMATSFMSAAQGAVGAAVNEGISGNLNYGNVTTGSRNAYSGVSIQNDHGQITRHWNDSTTSIDNSMVESRLGFNLHGSERMESALSSQISHEQSLAQTKSIQASQTQAHGFEMMLNNHREIENSKGFEQSLSSEERSAFSRINNAVSDFAQEHGITREKSAEIFGNIGVGIGSAIGIPGTGGKLGLSGDAKGGYAYNSRDSDQQHYKEALNYSRQHSLSKDFATVQSAVQSNRLNFNDSRGESISETFNTAASLNRESGQHFEKARRYSEMENNIRSRSAEYDESYNQEFWGELVAKYGSHRAAEITNPSNQDKTILNREIGSFIDQKTEEISKIQRPNFESEYNANSAKFSGSNDLYKVSNQNPYQFSNSYQQIDNSNLEEITSEKFSDTKQKIDQAQINNSDLGKKVIHKVREEEDGL